MEFENYANRIKSLISTLFKNLLQSLRKSLVLNFFRGKWLKKAKFSQLNEKRFHFPDGIFSLPYGHKSLKEIDDFKKEKGQKIEKYFWEEKEKLLEMEKGALKNTPRLHFYH